ncbi:hypothetical protein CC86DRAFT_456871 [Ophiobolus disseminans]|uniref:SH3 domain-containing protein n=1 Tax=Ophiobolus disseminans TaxID=1469910 RepID=A0A6A6ZV39_9PLEO|nr:hypothetical protein CC86DRAFT_456871 [Ophiobolus disseminans]
MPRRQRVAMALYRPSLDCEVLFGDLRSSIENSLAMTASTAGIAKTDERHKFWHDDVLYWKARESLYEALRGCQGTSYARSREKYQWTIGSVQQLFYGVDKQDHIQEFALGRREEKVASENKSKKASLSGWQNTSAGCGRLSWSIMEKKKFGAVVMDRLRFQVVCTVPAVWTTQAVYRMREAAGHAGILSDRSAGPTSLRFVSEPEAAALATLEDLKARPNFKKGDTFVICDAGGGTVDLISYRVLEANPMVLAECVQGQGRLVWDVPKSAIKDMMNVQGENGIKRGFEGQKKDWQIRLLYECIERGAPHIITLSQGHVKEIFDNAVSQVQELVNDQTSVIEGVEGKLPKLENKHRGIDVYQSMGTKPTADIAVSIYTCNSQSPPSRWNIDVQRSCVIKTTQPIDITDLDELVGEDGFPFKEVPYELGVSVIGVALDFCITCKGERIGHSQFQAEVQDHVHSEPFCPVSDGIVAAAPVGDNALVTTSSGGHVPIATPSEEHMPINAQSKTHEPVTAQSKDTLPHNTQAAERPPTPPPKAFLAIAPAHQLQAVVTHNYTARAWGQHSVVSGEYVRVVSFYAQKGWTSVKKDGLIGAVPASCVDSVMGGGDLLNRIPEREGGCPMAGTSPA